MSFAVGDAVVVSDRVHSGHHRTPRYLKGRHGTVARAHGAFPDPETRAYGGDGSPPRKLYLVAFPPSEGAADAQIYADLFEHWLERAS